jgi:hypothetical protein
MVVREHDLIDIQLRTATAGQAPPRRSRARRQRRPALDASRRRSYLRVRGFERFNVRSSHRRSFGRSGLRSCVRLEDPDRERHLRAERERRPTAISPPASSPPRLTTEQLPSACGWCHQPPQGTCTPELLVMPRAHRTCEFPRIRLSVSTSRGFVSCPAPAGRARSSAAPVGRRVGCAGRRGGHSIRWSTALGSALLGSGSA